MSRPLARSGGFVLAVLILVAACAPAAAPSGPGSVSPGTSGAVPAGALAGQVVPVGATASVDDGSWALADRLAAPSYTTDTTAALVAGLARAGIGTYADPASSVPESVLAGRASPFRLLDFQAHALAVGAWAGSSFSGAELDTVMPLPKGLSGQPTTSDLLAAYVGSADSAGGALSRALMAGQDLLQPAGLEFPAVVLVLFASDLASEGPGTPGPSPSPSPSTSAAAAAPLVRLAVAGSADAGARIVATDGAGICSATSDWINGVIHTLFDALKLATPDNLPGAIITGIWNWLVSKGEALVHGLISSLTDAVLGTIRSIAGTIAGVAEQIASFLPYAVKVIATGDPGGATFKLGSDPLRGTFTASISAGDLPDWPAVLKDCAAVAGIALADFHARNVPLTWGPVQPAADPLLGPIDADRTNDVTDGAGQATWGFLTSRDPGDPTGEQLNQVDRITVAVHRPEIDAARAHLTDALLGFIPKLLRSFVAGLFAPFLDGLQSRLNALLDAHGTGLAILVYHGQASPKPSASASPAPSGSCATSLPAGTYQGTLETSVTTIVPPGQIDLGEHGGDNDHGSGPLTVVVAPDGTLSGSFSQTMAMHFEASGLAVGTTDTTVVETGAGVSGTLCSLTLAFASETITACTATGKATCGGVGQTMSLAGLVPALPLGAPTSVAGGKLTWSISNESSVDAGFGGLSAETQSTITVTLEGH